MRTVFLSLLIGMSCLSLAIAAPRSKGKPKTKAPTKPRVSAAPKGTPLSPALLKGKIVYILSRNVWALDPQSRRKTLLYKDLFFPANKDPNSYTDNYGGGLGFDHSNIAWSPDLTRVAFTHYDPRFQGSELFIMRWDGKEKRQISNEKYDWTLRFPRWSPDGKSIAIVKSSPYRMGSPGYGSADVVLFGFDAKMRTFNKRNERGEELSGTFINPFWSRDGQKILLDYSPQSSDYVDATNITPQVVSLDETPIADFKNNWSDFLIDNQSRNGKWRLEHSKYSAPGAPDWQLYQSSNNGYVGTILRENNGLHADRFCINDEGTKLVWQGNLSSWTIDPAGNTHPNNISGIWTATTTQISHPRLLVENGRLVNWL